MMTVLCGKEPEHSLDISYYLFKLESTKDWFNDPLVEEIVLDIDKLEHIRDSIFYGPEIGAITADQLSRGVKGLILILKSSKLKLYSAIHSSIFSDDCVKWLIKLSYIRDFTIYMICSLDFYFGGNYSKNFDGYRNTPINAVGETGETLPTCHDVMRYFEDNYTSENWDDMDICYHSDSEDSAASIAAESEGYTSKCDYIIPIDSPFWEELDALYENVETIKPEEEEGLREEIRKLTALYKKSSS